MIGERKNTMNIQEVANTIRESGLPVLEVKEFGDNEGEIKLNNKFSVQVGPGGTYYCVTYEDGHDTLVYAPLKSTVKDVILDAKQALKLN